LKIWNKNVEVVERFNIQHVASPAFNKWLFH